MADWGPLAQPTHAAGPDPGSTAPWRDNAYVLFWDPDQDVFGTVHVSTSPNADGRRARATFIAGGVTAEIIEPLDPGSFTSPSIAFGLDGTLTVDHEDIGATLACEPRLALGDFTQNGVLPEMGGEPPRHYQQTVAVTGTCTIAGRHRSVDATGVRDRTWGYRDESVNIAEYLWAFASFEGWSLTAMRFTDGGGADRTDGFILRDGDTESVTGLGVTRDASGLCAALELTLAGGAVLNVRSGGRRGGLWVPMGSERRGPAMSAYDEFCSFETDAGEPGFGLVEHGAVRRLY